MERYAGYDLDDIPGDIPRLPDSEVDAEIDRRQQDEIEEFSVDRINAAIKVVNANMKVPA